MSNQSFYQTEISDYSFFNDESIQEQTIELLPQQVSWAAQLSETVRNKKRRWQIYLNSLALQGYRLWMEEWAPDLSIDDSDCSILQPQYANLIEAVCNLQVGAFTVCLLAVNNATEESINLPRAVIDLPQFTSHFYVVVNVLEEQAQAQIYGYLRHDELIGYRSIQTLTADSADSDWTLQISLACFNLDSSALLLDLHHLEATAISLTVPPLNFVSTQQLQAKLAKLQEQLHSPKHLPEQFLTWEEGATLLSHSDLINTYLLEPISSSPRLQMLTQRVINAGLWLQDQLDGLAQDLDWMLMPATLAFRAQAQAFETVRTELERQEIAIPASARGAYRDITYASFRLRLYALVWPLPPTDTTSEWTLLLSLGTEADMQMPSGVQLTVQDENQVLAERISTGMPEDAFLCIQVAGTWDEQFRVIVTLPDGTVIPLPSFAFEPTLS